MATAPIGEGEQVYTYRDLHVCLTRKDWHAFADTLYDELPDARYYFCPSIFTRMWPVPPPCGVGEHMFRMADEEGGFDPAKLHQCEMHFDPDWKPEWIVVGDPINDMLPEPGAYWDLRQPKLPAFRFEFSYRQDASYDSPEHLTDGEYWFFYAPGNRDHLELGHRVFRLFRQFATNRNQAVVYPATKTVKTRKISPLWLGHDAIRWAREDENRLLSYWRYEDEPERSHGVRPLEP
jgi:hypothetical protein